MRFVTLPVFSQTENANKSANSSELMNGYHNDDSTLSITIAHKQSEKQELDLKVTPDDAPPQPTENGDSSADSGIHGEGVAISPS